MSNLPPDWSGTYLEPTKTKRSLHAFVEFDPVYLERRKND